MIFVFAFLCHNVLQSDNPLAIWIKLSVTICSRIISTFCVPCLSIFLRIPFLHHMPGYVLNLFWNKFFKYCFYEFAMRCLFSYIYIYICIYVCVCVLWFVLVSAISYWSIRVIHLAIFESCLSGTGATEACLKAITSHRWQWSGPER